MLMYILVRSGDMMSRTTIGKLHATTNLCPIGEIGVYIPGAGPALTLLRADELRLLDYFAEYNCDSYPYSGGQWDPAQTAIASEAGLRKLHAEITRAATLASTGAVPVRPVGETITDWGIPKILVEVQVRHRYEYQHVHENMAIGVTQKADETSAWPIELPAHHLYEIGDQHFAPRAAVLKAIGDSRRYGPSRIIRSNRGASLEIVGITWPQADAVWREFFEPLVALAEDWEGGQTMKNAWRAEMSAARRRRRQAQALEAAEARRQLAEVDRLVQQLADLRAALSARPAR